MLQNFFLVMITVKIYSLSNLQGYNTVWILEWVAISFSRRSSQPRDWTRFSHIVGRRFSVLATWEVIINSSHSNWVEKPLEDSEQGDHGIYYSYTSKSFWL